ncbi:MAG TPA: hypothetical protein VGG09_02885 [Acidimicrobiales bacterium]|jgi:hypothetical protein
MVVAALMVLPLIGVGTSAGAAAGAATVPAYAPPDTPGPALDVPASQLDSALTCSTSAASATRDIILVLPPTLFDPGEAYTWNYLPAFDARGWPHCELTVPDHSDGDIQVAAEYVVNAVRFLSAYSGRQVELFGWSQGASTLPRWALRWWPDIRPMVASLVGLAPDNEYGTTDPAIEAVCAYECFPAAWQETHRLIGGESQFMAALNSDEQTFPGIAYTDIWNELDEVAGWNFGSDKVSPLPPSPNVLNVATQSLCPLQVYEHLTIPADGIAYQVAMAALATPGQLPDLAAIDRAQVCPQLLMPYVSPASLALNEANLVALVAERATVGMITAEPPLRCYVTASCGSGGARSSS